jgi:DNA-binding NarL/FixJ family response regulator
MPKMNGIEAARMLTAGGFAGKIVMLTQYDKEEYVREAIQTGASGYLLKDSIKDDVIAAIRKVMSDETFFSPAVSKLLVDDYFKKLKGKSSPERAPDLTSRETEVLRLIAEGLSTKQIAERLYLSPRTVDFHRANICQKLDLHDIAGLTKYAIRQGLVKI